MSLEQSSKQPETDQSTVPHSGDGVPTDAPTSPLETVAGQLLAPKDPSAIDPVTGEVTWQPVTAEQTSTSGNKRKTSFLVKAGAGLAFVAAGAGLYMLGRGSGSSPSPSTPVATATANPGPTAGQATAAASQTPEVQVTSLPSTEVVKTPAGDYGASVEKYKTPEVAVPKLFDNIHSYLFSGDVAGFKRGEPLSGGKPEILAQIFTNNALQPTTDAATAETVHWLKEVSIATTERQGLGDINYVKYALDIKTGVIKELPGGQLQVEISFTDNVGKLPYNAQDLTHKNTALMTIVNKGGLWKIDTIQLIGPLSKS